MAIICRDFNILFIMTPRTACTAVGKILKEKMGGEYIPKKNILDSNGYFKVQKKHSTITQLLEHQLITEREIESLLTLTTVRNPFDSLVSLYFKKRGKYSSLLKNKNSWVYHIPNYVEDLKYCRNHSFNEWIFKNYKRGMIKRLIGGKPSMYRRFTEYIDEIMLFEKIKHDFQKIMNKVNNIEDIEIPKINTTKGRETDYRKYYSKRSKKIVEFVLKDDLQRYNYSF